MLEMNKLEDLIGVLIRLMTSHVMLNRDLSVRMMDLLRSPSDSSPSSDSSSESSESSERFRIKSTTKVKIKKFEQNLDFFIEYYKEFRIERKYHQ